MEYFLGSIITLAVIVVLGLIARRYKNDVFFKVDVSQSTVHEMLRDFLPPNHKLMKHQKSQSSKHMEQITTRIVFIDNKAYWIKDNKFYVADAINQNIDESTKQEVDTMSMDKVELNKIIFIVETLTEGK